MLDNLGIKIKMVLSIVLSAVASVLIAVFGGIGIDKVDAESQHLYQREVLAMSYLEEVHASELKSRLDLHRIAASATTRTARSGGARAWRRPTRNSRRRPPVTRRPANWSTPRR